MELHLTCARCGTHWLVQHWKPDAMRCPKCHGLELGDALRQREDQQRVAKREALRGRKTV